MGGEGQFTKVLAGGAYVHRGELATGNRERTIVGGEGQFTKVLAGGAYVFEAGSACLRAASIRPTR